jgi:hypothetical protein
VGTAEGSAVGVAVGTAEGSAIGDAVRTGDGFAVGDAVGTAEGSAVGVAVGTAVDSAIGDAVRTGDGFAVGNAVVGRADGFAVADAVVGTAVDSAVGDAVVGMANGSAVGDVLQWGTTEGSAVGQDAETAATSTAEADTVEAAATTTSSSSSTHSSTLFHPSLFPTNHPALLQLLTTLPPQTFEDAFKAVANNDADYAVVPIENSLGGSIHSAFDLLLRYNLYVIGEHEFKVEHTLLALPGVKIEDIKIAMSHPQALWVCVMLLYSFFSSFLFCDELC